MQLIVLGMHRSGTSVLARLLNLMGAYFAPEGLSTGANQENPKGFWERRDVRVLNDFVLQGAGCDWNRVTGFDLDSLSESLVAEFEKRASQVVLSMDAYRPWLLKEPRLCLLFPLWRRVLETPVCIHILRHPVEVASSLRTRNQIPIDAGLALWEHYNQSARTAMRDLPRLVVHHRDLMREPVKAASLLFQQLESSGVRRLTLPSASEIESFIDAKLYRERVDKPGLEAYAASPQVKLFEQWAAGTETRGAYKGLSSKAKAVLVAYESLLPPMVVPSAAAPKKNVEAELREKIAASTRELGSLKEQLGHAKALQDTYERQLAFAQQELKAQREAHAERDRWLQERDRGAEDDRSRLSGEVTRLTEHVRQLVVARDQLNAKREAEAAEFAARESSLREKMNSLGKELAEACTALRKTEGLAQKRMALIDETRSSLKRMAKEKEVHERHASERSLELAKLTRLYLDARLVEERSVTTVRATEAALMETNAVMRKLQEEHAVALSASTSEIQTLRKRIEGHEQRARQDQAENELCATEIARLDAMLAALVDSASWKVTAPLRQLRALLAGRRLDPAQENSSRLDLLRRSPWFDAEWYAREHGAMIQGHIAPEAHYLLRGAVEGLNPSERFDTKRYLASNPDVLESGQNPLVHFILYGEAEGRSPGAGGRET